MKRAERPASLTLALLALAPCLALAGAPPPGGLEEANDTVHVNDTSQPNVKIVEDSWKGVTIERGLKQKVKFTFDVLSVQGVDYGERVAEYEQALEAKRTGDYGKAADLFNAGLGKTKNKLQHQYFLAGLVECYERLKKPEEMRAYVRKMVNLNPKLPPRLIYDVYLKLGESYLRVSSKADYPNAEKGYKEALDFFLKLETQAATLRGVRDKVKRYRLMAKYWWMYCIEKQGRIKGREGAQRAYFLLQAEASGHPDLVYLGKIGEIRCKSITKPENAIKELDKMIKEVTDPKTKDKGALPALLVALGDVYFNKLDYRQARWYYLRVIVRDSTDRAAVARAHYQAGRCYEELGKSPVREQEAVRRALRHYKIVKEEFQESLEHPLAKERLKNLGT